MYRQYSQLTRLRESKVQIRAGIYARCSSDEQKKNGYTVSDQVSFGYQFAKDNDLVVVEEYVDEGISATLEIHKRKDLARLIEEAKEGKLDIIVFKCIDRFFRNVEEYYACQKQLRKAGVTWLSIEESDLDPEDPEAAFKINIYLTMAEYEARKTSKRINFNNVMRVKNKQVVTGQQCFHFPWKVVGEPRNRHLERNMEYADILYEILDHFETHQSKRATLYNYNSKYGKEMSMKSFTKLITNPLLYGEYKGVQNYVEPYITKERFDHIQSILKRNSRYSPNRNNTFLFSGMLKCRCCGRNLVGNYHHRGGNKYSYVYRCNKNRTDKACQNSHSTTEGKIEKQLLDNLNIYMAHEIIKVESIKEKESPAADYTKKIEAIKKEQARLNNMYRKGRMEESEYDEEYAVLEKELKKFEELEKPEERNLDNIKALLESDWLTIYNALDKEHKKAFWKNTIKEFAIDENRRVVPESIIFF